MPLVEASNISWGDEDSDAGGQSMQHVTMMFEFPGAFGISEDEEMKEVVRRAVGCVIVRIRLRNESFLR